MPECCSAAGAFSEPLGCASCPLIWYYSFTRSDSMLSAASLLLFAPAVAGIPVTVSVATTYTHCCNCCCCRRLLEDAAAWHALVSQVAPGAVGASRISSKIWTTLKASFSALKACGDASFVLVIFQPMPVSFTPDAAMYLIIHSFIRVTCALVAFDTEISHLRNMSHLLGPFSISIIITCTDP